MDNIYDVGIEPTTLPITADAENDAIDVGFNANDDEIEVAVVMDSSALPLSVEASDNTVNVSVPDTREGEIAQAIAALENALETIDDTVDDRVEVWGRGITASATTLPAGSSATAEYANRNFAFGIPRGDKGEKGDANIDSITNSEIEALTI